MTVTTGATPEQAALSEQQRDALVSEMSRLQQILEPDAFHCFCGDDTDHRRALECHALGGDWAEEWRSSDVVLTPASCYPVYPIVARRGPLPDGGWLVTERPGRLRIVGPDGRVSDPVAGLPPVDARGQGGLLDVAIRDAANLLANEAEQLTRLKYGAH